MEAERPVAVVERLLEHRLEGEFTFVTTPTARASIALRGKADRVDLLEDGTFRLIDYKLGWPPNRARALQLPIYSLCAEQRLAGHRGRTWTLGEAVYLAFKGPRRVVPLFTRRPIATKVLSEAQQRLADAVDAIARGEFPPRRTTSIVRDLQLCGGLPEGLRRRCLSRGFRSTMKSEVRRPSQTAIRRHLPSLDSAADSNRCRRRCARNAVDPAQNVVLEASAGTGKTRVLVERYVNLLAQESNPITSWRSPLREKPRPRCGSGSSSG